MNRSMFDNKWAIRIISLIFAIFLYAFVASENSNSMRMARNQEFASINVTETISNVPVYLGETDEDLFVSGLPEQVTVRLTGPRNLVNQVTEDTLRVETESLLGAEPGSQTVRLEATGLPEEIEYQITPSRVIVQVSKRETMKLPVEYDIDPNLLKEGYEVSQVTLDTSEVTLSGTSQAIDSLKRAYILISADEKKSESFTDTYQLKMVDGEGNLLDINADQTEIKAEVEIVPQSQEVPLKVVPSGESDNYTYEYQFANQSRVVINASSPVESIDVKVDVSSLKESGDVTGELVIPENVQYSGPKEISIYVTMQGKDRVGPEESAESTNQTEGASGEISESSQEAGVKIVNKMLAYWKSEVGQGALQ